MTPLDIGIRFREGEREARMMNPPLPMASIPRRRLENRCATSIKPTREPSPSAFVVGVERFFL